MHGSDVAAMGWRAESRLGVVGAGGAESVAAGIGILERGGNAADAAAATILALTITDHGECSIGGEAPLLIYDGRRQEVKALCGQGRAPRSAEAIRWYMANGIPDMDVKMAPVPAVVDLCTTLLQRYGTMTLADVSAPTLALLAAGSEPWHPRLASTFERMLDEERRTDGSRAAKLQAASDRFYGRHSQRHDIADDLEAFYIAHGGFLRRSDLAAHATRLEDPVTVDYRGYTVCKCGPWTQGPVLCQALRLLEGFDLRTMGAQSPDTIHAVAEAMKLAMADRDAYYGDPEFVSVPLAALLSDAYTEIRRPLIDMAQASLEARPGDPHAMRPLRAGGAFRPGIGGTTTCVVADRWGTVIAATPSANVHLDAAAGGKAGVTFGNRLRSLNTTPGHPNCIQPGKRPRITLTPTLVLKGGRPFLAVSVAGGDLQDQATLNLLLNVLDFGQPLETAVASPRFATRHHEDSFDPHPERDKAFLKAGSLVVDERIGADVRDALSARGHAVETMPPPVARPVMLQVDAETGFCRVAGDPTAKRHAAGLG